MKFREVRPGTIVRDPTINSATREPATNTLYVVCEGIKDRFLVNTTYWTKRTLSPDREVQVVPGHLEVVQ